MAAEIIERGHSSGGIKTIIPGRKKTPLSKTTLPGLLPERKGALKKGRFPEGNPGLHEQRPQVPKTRAAKTGAAFPGGAAKTPDRKERLLSSGQNGSPQKLIPNLYPLRTVPGAVNRFVTFPWL